MIKTFNHKGLKLLWEKDDVSKLPPEQADKLRRILSVLNTAKTLEPVRAIPGYRLHSLSGKLEGFWSVWITGSCSGLRMAMCVTSIMSIIIKLWKVK